MGIACSKHLWCATLLGPLLTLSSVAQVSDTGQTRRELEAEVQQWLDLNRQIGRESEQWSRDKEKLTQELQLLLRETEALVQVQEKSEKQQQELKQDLASLRREKASLVQQREQLDRIVGDAEGALRNWESRLPPALLAPLRDGFAALGAGEDSPSRLLPARLHNVVTLYTEIARLQNSFHLVRDRVETGDETRETDVFYVGLSAGFAVSADGHWAAVGHPGPNGWTWDEQPGLTDAIRAAINIHNQTTAPRLIELPVTLGGHVEEAP